MRRGYGRRGTTRRAAIRGLGSPQASPTRNSQFGSTGSRSEGINGVGKAQVISNITNTISDMHSAQSNYPNLIQQPQKLYQSKSMEYLKPLITNTANRASGTRKNTKNTASHSNAYGQIGFQKQNSPQIIGISVFITEQIITATSKSKESIIFRNRIGNNRL